MADKVIQTDFKGDPNIGLYGFATSNYAVVGAKSRHLKKMKVPVYRMDLYSSRFVGLFGAGNEKGVVLPDIVKKDEVAKLRENVDVLMIKNDYSAIGNLILMNDSGVVISPLLRQNKKEIEGFFGLKTETSTIAGLGIIGSCAVATNHGCLVHPEVKKTEMNVLKKILKVECDIGTVSFGSPYVRTGLIANQHAVLCSSMCSGPELGRIVETLGFL